MARHGLRKSKRRRVWVRKGEGHQVAAMGLACLGAGAFVAWLLVLILAS